MDLDSIVKAYDSVSRTSGLALASSAVMATAVRVASAAYKGSGPQATFLGELVSRPTTKEALAMAAFGAAAASEAFLLPGSDMLKNHSTIDYAVKLAGTVPVNAVIGAVTWPVARGLFTKDSLVNDYGKNAKTGLKIGAAAAVAVPLFQIAYAYAAPYIQQAASSVRNLF